MWAVSGYAAWMAGDVAEAGARGARALRVSERAGGDIPSPVGIDLRPATSCSKGGSTRRPGGTGEPATRPVDDLAQRLMAASTELLALAYAGDPTAADAAGDVLAEVGEAQTPYAAYVWFCAGESDLSVDVERARARLVHALELAEVTDASFVAGVAGASKASIEARVGDPLVAADDFRRLITHWRRAGMWSTQWTMLRSIAGLLARLGRPREAAVLVGAVQATSAGHRIFGADEAALAELDAAAAGGAGRHGVRRRARRGRRARRRRGGRARPAGPVSRRPAHAGATPSAARARRPAARLAPTGCMKPPALTSRHALASGCLAR